MIEFIRDFWQFLKVRKKFWLLPLLLMLLILSVLATSSQPLALAFIYSMF